MSYLKFKSTIIFRTKVDLKERIALSGIVREMTGNYFGVIISCQHEIHSSLWGIKIHCAMYC